MLLKNKYSYHSFKVNWNQQNPDDVTYTGHPSMCIQVTEVCVLSPLIWVSEPSTLEPGHSQWHKRKHLQNTQGHCLVDNWGVCPNKKELTIKTLLSLRVGPRRRSISSPESALLLVSTRKKDSGHSKAGSPQIMDFRLVYARSEIWNSCCQRLQKWTFNTTAHKMKVAWVRVLGADQKKSGLWDEIA